MAAVTTSASAEIRATAVCAGTLTVAGAPGTAECNRGGRVVKPAAAIAYAQGPGTAVAAGATS